MASVRERKFGKGKTAQVVDYTDLDGRRRLQTFKTRKAANVFKTAMEFALRVDADETVATSAPATPEPAQMDLVWGCDGIAKAIKRTKRQTFYMLESGALKATKVGNRWVADRQTLLSALLN